MGSGNVAGSGFIMGGPPHSLGKPIEWKHDRIHAIGDVDVSTSPLAGETN
jgi:hypothetical protein